MEKYIFYELGMSNLTILGMFSVNWDYKNIFSVKWK
jgi:hypothetical protein